MTGHTGGREMAHIRHQGPPLFRLHLHEPAPGVWVHFGVMCSVSSYLFPGPITFQMCDLRILLS